MIDELLNKLQWLYCVVKESMRNLVYYKVLETKNCFPTFVKHLSYESDIQIELKNLNHLIRKSKLNGLEFHLYGLKLGVLK